MAAFHQVVLFSLPQNGNKLIAGAQVIRQQFAAVAAVAVVAVGIGFHKALDIGDPLYADFLQQQNIGVILQNQVLNVCSPAVNIFIIDVVAQYSANFSHTPMYVR